MIEISASILEVDPLKYKENIEAAVAKGIKIIHFDITDGIFTKRISFGDRLIKSVLKSFDVKGEVHLMVSKPELQVENFLEIEGVETVYFHYQSSERPEMLIERIKQKGKKAGIALGQRQNINSVIPLLGKIDALLLLLVEPGMGGQTLNGSMLMKIIQAKRMREMKRFSYKIVADGGIKPENVREVINAGAERLVIGTGIFSGNIVENLDKLVKNLNVY